MATRSARRYRRAHRLRSNRRGVVAVVGTLLSLLVFFALFGIFLTQYMPLWMNDNEAAFTNSAATSFIEFKSGIDTQYALGLPPSVGTAFTISSAGVPLLAQPTEGTITFLPSQCPAVNGASFYVPGVAGATSANYGQPVNPAYCVFENQSISIGPGGSGPFYQKVATGILQMTLPNRYYTPVQFFFEDDGIIQSQAGGFQVMAYAPPFTVTDVSGNASVASSFLQLTGNSTSVIGQGTEEVYSHLRFTQQIASNGRPISKTNPALRPFNYTFEVGTQYPCAWSSFLQAQMQNSSGLPFVTNPTFGVASYNYSNPVTHARTIPYVGNCYNAGGATTVLAVNVNEINFANLFYAGVTVSIGIGST